MLTKPELGAAALACVLCLAVTAGPPGALERPALGGTWRLNERESDNPREKMREGLRRGPMGGGPGGRGGMRAGGRRGGFPGGGPGLGGPGEGTSGPQALERMEARFRTLRIRHEEPTLHVEYGDESDDTFYADGRKVKRYDERGEVVVQTKWKDGRVVVEQSAGRGKVTQTFELAPGGKRLYLTTRLGRGPMGGVAVRRVYDAEPAEPAAASPGPAPSGG